MNTRRKFLKQLGIITTAGVLAENILAEPYQRLFIPSNPSGVIRIKGTVTSDSKPLANVVVSDGVEVTKTNTDGAYEIVSCSNQDYVFISIPAGYEIPISSDKTAGFYKKISAQISKDITIDFRLNKTDDDNEHSFLLLADPQTLDMDDIYRFNIETIEDIKNLTSKNLNNKNIFAVSCGDIMYDRLELFPEYKKAISKLNIPFFQVFGNHDVDIMNKTDETAHLTFQKFFGPRYYSFNRGEIHYIVLDNIFWFGKYIGYIDQTQLDWLQKDLNYVEKGKTVVVFCHIPPNNFNSKRNEISTGIERVTVVNRELLYNTLKDYKSYIISGHMHESEFISENDLQIHVCGAVCGAWWTDNICYDGTPNGYMIYSVKGSNLSWIYKSTGNDLDYQLRTYINKSDSNASEIIVNVWSVNQDDNVFWYKNGIRQGKLTRFTGFDPLAEKIFSGADKPDKHKWIDPTKTDHLFKGIISNDSNNIFIEYIDNFGRTFNEKIEL